MAVQRSARKRSSTKSSSRKSTATSASNKSSSRKISASEGIHAATNKIKAKTSIDFSRSVRGK